ncbi:phosphoesterase [Rhodobacteraceae bacterium Araon29]
MAGHSDAGAQLPEYPAGTPRHIMTQAIHNYENPDLARLKAAAAHVVATTTDHDPRAGVPIDHPLLRGVDDYAAHALKGKTIPRPATTDASDPEAAAYLAYLMHHKAHAGFTLNKKIESDLQAQLDRFTFGNPDWQRMFDQYVAYFWAYPGHTGGVLDYRSWRDPKYGNGDLNFGTIEWCLPSNATVALIGDIGTGVDIAARVLASALSFKPDVILHVGDVYYSGTQWEFDHYFVGLLKAAFDAAGHAPPVYTLPGNHEYFSGAFPYFKCLDSRTLVHSPDQSQRASFFKLTTEDGGWQFLGMDTGYHGHYMGVKGDKLAKALKAMGVNPKDVRDPVKPPEMVHLRPDEVDWHRYHLGQFQGRSILFGHHQLYSANQKVGADPTSPDDYARPGVNIALWQAMGPYFDKVAAWFWGHEHNLCIFEDDYRPEGRPAPSEAPDDPWKTLHKGRCIGHSAIPVAEKETPYKANNPVPLIPDTQLAMTGGWYNRGYQILKLNGAGKAAHCSYYQINGADPKPIKIYSENIS